MAFLVTSSNSFSSVISFCVGGFSILASNFSSSFGFSSSLGASGVDSESEEDWAAARCARNLAAISSGSAAAFSAASASALALASASALAFSSASSFAAASWASFMSFANSSAAASAFPLVTSLTNGVMTPSLKYTILLISFIWSTLFDLILESFMYPMNALFASWPRTSSASSSEILTFSLVLRTLPLNSSLKDSVGTANAVLHAMRKISPCTSRSH
mmetsp:Transcript_4474/g.15438  ORF Transcript_4474/g.15438 Transcript_4474/m.15438 type:complete len:218 (-) Transcript_4474:1635-2288(-)